MKTAKEIGLARGESRAHIIPAMTHELGSAWKQPSRFNIEVDDRYALMSQRDFDALAEYSASRPSGVYPGKMWRRHDGQFDMEFRRTGGRPVWMLCWYGEVEGRPDLCSNHHREIIIA
jgi:hypothetical protein